MLSHVWFPKWLPELIILLLILQVNFKLDSLFTIHNFFLSLSTWVYYVTIFLIHFFIYIMINKYKWNSDMSLIKMCFYISWFDLILSIELPHFLKGKFMYWVSIVICFYGCTWFALEPKNRGRTYIRYK